jgi:hypothetical protein
MAATDAVPGSGAHPTDSYCLACCAKICKGNDTVTLSCDTSPTMPSVKMGASKRKVGHDTVSPISFRNGLKKAWEKGSFSANPNFVMG